jgi:hypothetical protein
MRSFRLRRSTTAVPPPMSTPSSGTKKPLAHFSTFPAEMGFHDDLIVKSDVNF